MVHPPITFPPNETVVLTEEQIAEIAKEMKRLRCCAHCEAELSSWELRAHTGLCFICVRKEAEAKKAEHLRALSVMTIEERLAILEAFAYEHSKVDHKKDMVMR